MEFKTVELLDIVKQKAIDRQQFIQSVVDNLRLRLCEPDEADAQILNDCLIFDTHRYLANVALRFVLVKKKCVAYVSVLT